MAVKERVSLYRATAESWFGRFLLPFSFATLLIFTSVNVAGFSPALGGLALLVLSITAVFEYLLPMLRTWLRLDDRSLEGHLSGSRFRIYWTEVIAAWTIDRGPQRFLCLGTRQGTAIIPLRFLAAEQIWTEIRQRVAPAALEPDARQRLPDYKEWTTARDLLIRQEFAPRQVVDHWIIQMVGWTGLAFCIATAFEAWSQGEWGVLSTLAIPGLLSGSLIIHWGVTEIDPEGIRRRTLFGSWQIRWDQLRWLEMDLTGTTLVLGGENCQMVISGPVMWAGADRADVLAMIHAQTESRKLPLRRSMWAAIKPSRNTRIKKK